MNFLGQTLPQRREAKLRFLDADFQILREGDHVRCAVTGDPIALQSLRYWDVARQLPFRNAETAFAERLKRLA
jgi:hypothetical protein